MSSVARFDTWQAADGTNVARFNAGALEVWDGAAWALPASPTIDYLIVAGGGGGGGGFYGGGGGAGGYLCSVDGELSGGNALPQRKLEYTPGTPFNITVGAGGAAGANQNLRGGNGADSVLGSLTANGGGGGGARNVGSGLDGGSGGGLSMGDNDNIPGSALEGQGFDGGATRYGSGGGGASERGVAALNTTSIDTPGGDGLASSITGSSVYRAGGGGGGKTNGATSTALGGGGAGGSASPAIAATAGTANTGGGGGGGGGDNTAGAAGGSGIVIFAVPTGTSVSFSGGVTQTSSTVGSNDVYTVTAAGPSDTVTIG